jgi:hypothetical protein
MLEYPGVELVFGSRETGMGFASAPAIATPGIDVEDVAVPSQDGTLMGVDVIEGPLVTFEIDVVSQDRDGVKAIMEPLRRAWRGDAVRSVPGAVAALRSDRGKVTFGRPRRFTSADDDDRFGVSRVTCDFATVTDLWFGEEQTVTVPLVPPPGGGLVAPLAAPLSTTASSDRSQAVTLGGGLPTWPTVTVQGPITNPVIEVLGVFRWEFQGLTLAYDEVLVIDARPWIRTILRNGAAVPGRLTPRSTRLKDSAIPPGAHEFVLRGTSNGTPTATLAWRPAFHTP